MQNLQTIKAIGQHAVEDDDVPALTHRLRNALHAVTADADMRALLPQTFSDVTRVERIVFDDEVAVHAVSVSGRGGIDTISRCILRCLGRRR